MFTVEPASAEPLIVTAVACDGDAGAETSELGAVGAIVSFVKLTGVEQGDVLPAASVAVIVQLLVAFDVAVTARPDASAAAVLVTTAEPEQLEPLKILTVAPASADPVIVTAVDCDGEDGDAVSDDGADGGIESLT